MDSLQFENFELEEDGVLSQETSEGPDPFVGYSIKLIDVLDGKVSAYNQKHPSDKVFLSQLKQIYVDTASSCPENWLSKINTWALARVNMFLRIKSSKKIAIGKLEKDKTKITKLELENSQASCVLNKEIDATEHWFPLKEDFDLSEKDVDQHDLNFTFSNVDELYMENQEGPISIDFR
tara:strand:- start:117 stop:653 length:537 start_codon:yes stop_codon:yes gene_type:complete